MSSFTRASSSSTLSPIAGRFFGVPKRKTPGSGELSRVFVLRVAWIKVSAEALTLTGIGSLTITYFHTGIRTIIGVESFHGPVRDGKGWYRLAMVIRHDLLLYRVWGATANLGRSIEREARCNGVMGQ
jgi:hypothetical protein